MNCYIIREGGSGVLSVVLRGEGGLVFVYYVVIKNSIDFGGKGNEFCYFFKEILL